MALVTAIAYDTNRDLGGAYNRIMADLEPGDWCCFLDHDAMFTTDRWRAHLLEAIDRYPDVGMFAAMTNRIGKKYQIAKSAPSTHRLCDHLSFGQSMFQQHGLSAKDVTRESPISGVVMCISWDAWKKMGHFKPGFFGVDNRAHWDIAATGNRVYLLNGLYVYHFYRADGVGHGKNVPRAPRPSQYANPRPRPVPAIADPGLGGPDTGHNQTAPKRPPRGRNRRRHNRRKWK